MKIMIDLNVVLDVIQKRLPHYYASSTVLTKVRTKELTGYLPGHCLTTIYFIISKYTDKAQASETINWMITNFEIAVENKDIFIRALSFQIKDFEDAVVASLAENLKCNYIITRNVPDFKGTPVPAFTPEEFLDVIA